MEAVGGRWLSGPDDESIYMIQIPVSRKQVRAAMVAMVILGLVAASTSTPPVRAAGLAALGGAAGVALADETPCAGQSVKSKRKCCS